MNDADLEIATEEDGTPIRLERHCARCGAMLYSGYVADLNRVWRVQFFASADPAAPPLDRCPTCDAELQGNAIATMHEIDVRIAAQRDRFFAGTWTLDAEAVAVLLAQVERGIPFEQLAAELALTANELRATLSAWLERQASPQPANTHNHEMSV